MAGDAADGMYFIEEGTVSVRMDQEDTEIEISKLGKGQYFGELALVTHRPRAASVYATGGVVKLACKSYPGLGGANIENLSTSLLLLYRDSLMGNLVVPPSLVLGRTLNAFVFCFFLLLFIIFVSFLFFVLCTRSLTRRHLHLMYYCCSCVLFFRVLVVLLLLCCV